MHRPYDVEWFKERVKYIRSLMPDISTVSYTHLDVYKRQFLSWPKENMS